MFLLRMLLTIFRKQWLVLHQWNSGYGMNSFPAIIVDDLITPRFRVFPIFLNFGTQPLADNDTTSLYSIRNCSLVALLDSLHGQQSPPLILSLKLNWCHIQLLRHDDRFIPLGRLTNEYLVDMYSRIEDLRFQKLHKLTEQRAVERATDGVEEATSQQNTNSNETDIFFSKNVPGSRAWKSDQMADALAISNRYGAPSLFITISANPEWPDIKSRLLHSSQTAYDVTLIVARVFRARLEKAMDELKSKFGDLLYTIRVIEFQKRGLPHCHMVLKVCFFLWSLFIPKIHNLPFDMIDQSWLNCPPKTTLCCMLKLIEL